MAALQPFNTAVGCMGYLNLWDEKTGELSGQGVGYLRHLDSISAKEPRADVGYGRRRDQAPAIRRDL